MNILILSLYSPTKTNFAEGIGGGQEVIYQLGKRWIKKGHNVKILSAYRDKRIPREEELDGIEIKRVGHFYSAILSIWRAYRHEKDWADIVIENMLSYPLFIPIYVKKPRLAIIYHLMGPSYIIAAGMLKGTIGYLGEKMLPIIYKDEKIIVDSDLTRNDLIKLGLSGDRITVTPPGVNVNYYEPGIKKENPLISFIGNFEDGRKRVEDLVNAFSIINKAIPNAELILAGNGGKKEKKLLNLINGKRNIKYLGHIDENEKLEIYQQSWVFVNPSIMEGFGLTSIEANACGTPAIVYDLGGLDTIKHGVNGLVVEKGNINGLVDAIIKLLTNDVLREEMGINARKIAERFSWDRAAEEYLRVMGRERQKEVQMSNKLLSGG
jgi:glycosyltransferase involved in cell wall biosynthesis